MSLSDLTLPNAVAQALDEFDRIGRTAFLAKYGFGPARSYFLIRGGKEYDSKAIVGAAHGYQHGTPMTSADFSGGDATVAAKLQDLGFEVSRPGLNWHYAVGDVATRAEIHGTYGGATYGGIEPSNTTPNVMIYTDPVQGALNGYNYDGWDANDPNVFYYTGMGRHGDQEMTGRNRAILTQADDGRTLRLFEAVDEPQRAGGKRQTYRGAFYVDSLAPYRTAPAPDAAGEPRQVLVFRLVREGSTPLDVPAAPPAEGPAAAAPEDQADAVEAAPSAGAEAAEVDAAGKADLTGDAEVSLVASEQNTKTEFELQPRAGAVAQRDEAKLVSQFEATLRKQGHELARLRIKVPGERHELVTDTYDVSDNVLYEAKSKSDRATVRLAVGQLFDYLRFVPEASGAVLVPDEPTADVKLLIRACGFRLIYRRLGSWVTEL